MNYGKIALNLAFGLLVLTGISCVKSSGHTGDLVETQGIRDSYAKTDIGRDVSFNGMSSMRAVVNMDGEIMLPVVLDHKTSCLMAVDTGAVRTALEQTLLATVTNGVGRTTIDFGNGFVLKDFEVLAVDLGDARGHVGQDLGGLIGRDLFSVFYFGLDYRNKLVYMSKTDPQVPPPGFTPSMCIDLPFQLIQALPVVHAEVNGKDAAFIADTGSGVTIVTRSLVDDQTYEKGIKGYTWYTSYGSDPGVIVRLPVISLAGHEVKDSWAVVVPDDFHLKGVFDRIGLHVQGFIGYPVFRRFFVGLPKGKNRFELYPCPSLSHIDPHEWDRVGIEVVQKDTSFLVDMVFQPSDAFDKGLRKGDRIVAIDGSTTSGTDIDTLRRDLRGKPGQVKTIKYARGNTVSTIQVKVDRLLPELKE